MQGRLATFFFILLLLALPISLVNAYSNNQLVQNAVSEYKNFDFSTLATMTQEQMNDFLTSFSQTISTGMGDSVSAMVLNILVELLGCTVLILAIYYLYDGFKKTEFFKNNLSKTSLQALKKTPWVFIVQYVTSVISMGAVYASVVVFLPMTLLAGALNKTLFIAAAVVMGLLFLLVSWALQAFIMMFSYNITITVALGRMRMVLSMFYTKILLHKNKKFTFFLIAAGLFLETVLPLLLSVPAFYFNYIGSDKAVYFWAGASLLTVFIQGITMSFYTANFINLEKQKTVDLNKLYNAGTNPPDGENSDNNNSENQ
jgi:hypothetical protein